MGVGLDKGVLGVLNWRKGCGSDEEGAELEKGMGGMGGGELKIRQTNRDREDRCCVDLQTCYSIVILCLNCLV